MTHALLSEDTPMTGSVLAPAIGRFFAKPDNLLINGEWGQAAPGKRFDVVNPATGLVIASVTAGDEVDIDHAVSAARHSFETGVWRRTGAAVRAKILWRLADLIDANALELAHIETLNLGIPLAFARAQVANAAEAFRYYAGWCTKIGGRTADISREGRPAFAYTIKEPVGVVGLITPWNAPLLMACWKLAPALAAGCSCVLKPAEETPLTSLRLGELIIEAGVPAGVVNIVPGLGHHAGAALGAHADVDKISFTGSTEVGKLLVQAAAGNLKKLTLELGGKSPFLLFDDADLERAIPAAAAAIFTNSGQVCSAGSRLFVQRKVLDQVVDGLKAAVAAIRIGDGLAPDTQMGPLVSGKQLERVLGYVASGQAEGAELVAGGERVGERGFFMQPTLLANCAPTNPASREEIFGPVLAISAFDDVDEAVALANDSAYGLAAYVWSENGRRARQVSEAVRAGTIWVNTALITDYAAPAGGYKQSGWGRESGLEGLEPYLENKTIISQ